MSRLRGKYVDMDKNQNKVLKMCKITGNIFI